MIDEDKFSYPSKFHLFCGVLVQQPLFVTTTAALHRTVFLNKKRVDRLSMAVVLKTGTNVLVSVPACCKRVQTINFSR